MKEDEDKDKAEEGQICRFSYEVGKLENGDREVCVRKKEKFII